MVAVWAQEIVSASKMFVVRVQNVSALKMFVVWAHEIESALKITPGQIESTCQAWEWGVTEPWSEVTWSTPTIERKMGGEKDLAQVGQIDQ